MRKFCILLLILVFLSGCSEGLRTMIKLDKEQTAQHKDIAAQSKRFNLLLEHIESDKLRLGLSSKQIMNTYGQPIYVKEVEDQKRFLYRNPAEFNPLKKVYLYFDREDNLGDFELVVRKPEEEIQEVLQEEVRPEPQEELIEEEKVEELQEEEPQEESPELSSEEEPQEEPAAEINPEQL